MVTLQTLLPNFFHWCRWGPSRMSYLHKHEFEDPLLATAEMLSKMFWGSKVYPAVWIPLKLFKRLAKHKQTNQTVFME